MVLDNYVRLEEGVPTRIHVADHAIVTREIRDTLTGWQKPTTILELRVDEEGGRPVAKVLSVTAEKLAQQLAPYLPGHLYRQYTYTITRRGSGFATAYQVQVEPRITT
jgi:hypothetical protein